MTKIIRNSYKLSYFRSIKKRLMHNNRLKYITKNKKYLSTKKINKEKLFSSQKTISHIQQKQLFDLIKANKQFSSSTPIKILLNSSFQFTYPQKIIIRVSKSLTNNNFDEIDYKYNDKQVLYLQIKSQEFLSGQYTKSINQNDLQYSISVPQMNLSEQNYLIPQFVKYYFSNKTNNLYSVNLWHYKKQTLTKWHYDAHDNFLFQIKGVKQIFLIPPNEPDYTIKNKIQGSKLKQKDFKYIYCDSVFDIDNNHAKAQNNQQILTEQNSRFMKVLLKQNQCLFIPRGWFHQVKSSVDIEGNNMAINCWGNTIQTYKIQNSQLEINLKQVIYQISELICSNNIIDWIELDEELKQKFRKAYFCQYLNKII